MEPAISSIAFKGSIAEAVVEAKLQKKLFVVYISGDDAESINLEKSTWTNSTVAESLSNYCILLHIQGGSTEAAQFSAIYPQKSVPCIAAIGYNGVQLWQNEGFVSAEVLASSLEKAWLSLHIQETTATFLTAALASQKSEQLASGASGTSSSELGSSSRSDVPSPSIDEHRTLAYQEVMEGNKHCEQAEEVNCKLDNDVNSPKVSANELDTGDVEQAPLTETMKEPPNHEMVEFSNTGVGHMPSGVGDGSAVPEVNLNVVDQRSGVSVEASRVIISEASETVLDKKAEILEIEKADVLDFSRSKSDDVCLNIRLPSGVSLQEKFSITNTLRMVKDYVDENQESSIGSYDLAIPYPRKVFNDQDLSKTLSELGLLNRQALIVVPHHQAVGHHKGGYSSNKQTNSTNHIGSSNGTNEGYLSFVKRIISYVNPFSYLGGGASSSGPVEEPQNRMWQYSPNPALQNNLRGTERPQMANSPNQTNTAPTGVNNRKRFGSNIHTLKHDEDDSRFNDRNAFWNGNSTQYGGDNDGK